MRADDLEMGHMMRRQRSVGSRDREGEVGLAMWLKSWLRERTRERRDTLA